LERVAQRILKARQENSKTSLNEGIDTIQSKKVAQNSRLIFVFYTFLHFSSRKIPVYLPPTFKASKKGSIAIRAQLCFSEQIVRYFVCVL